MSVCMQVQICQVNVLGMLLSLILKYFIFVSKLSLNKSYCCDVVNSIWILWKIVQLKLVKFYWAFSPYSFLTLHFPFLLSFIPDLHADSLGFISVWIYRLCFFFLLFSAYFNCLVRSRANLANEFYHAITFILNLVLLICLLVIFAMILKYLFVTWNNTWNWWKGTVW